MAVNKTMLFGPIGRQVEVPWPLSGMSSDVNLVTETTELLSGELSVYRAPVTYKTYNMNWRSGSQALQPLLDMYAGVYGTGPYYMTDPLSGVQGNNLLPAKWAAPHLLAATSNGWCTPVVTAQSNTPESKQVTFTANLDDPADYPKPIVVPVIPGQPLYFALWGSATGSAQVKAYRYYRSTQSWVQISLTYVPTLTNDVPSNVVTQAMADAGDVAAIKLVPYVPAGSTLTLQHIDLAINDYRNYTPYLYGLSPGLLPSGGLYPGMTLFPSSQFGQTVGTGTMFRSGKGIGPVQFTGNAGGKLDSVVIDRIGLSLDVSEVSRDPNN